ncbi:unnamed protein product [Bemisia tabaci]|uniref:Immunoglobulin-like beta-sandwich domain-containing protein n=1 Tax=Bemisia tabaci TaxID=7038 RepID=A0A9P0EYT8_BEMTA|nr:unnamed protein product [Bemisia tabaci]
MSGSPCRREFAIVKRTRYGKKAASHVEATVGWIRAEDQTILALHTRVVTHSARFSVSHDALNESWNLHIRQIKETDRGCYMCQVNTSIMKKQVGCIDVFANKITRKRELIRVHACSFPPKNRSRAGGGGGGTEGNN